MPIEILMPALSPTMKEGNLAKWLKKEGDKVSPGQVIAEIETDKATMEVEAVDEGIIGKIIVPQGAQNVAVNELIAILLEEGEDKAALEGFKAKPAAAGAVPKAEAPKAASKTAPQSVSTSGERILASPLAKRIAANDGVNLSKVTGTGPNGRIVKDDVLAAAKGGAKPAPASFASRNDEEYTLLPVSNMRKVIAKRLLESKQTIPHFYLNIECQIDQLLALRKGMNEASDAYKLSVNDFVILAVAKALAKVPAANASWTEEGIWQYNNVDVSVAVAIDEGLITPIVRSANLKTISQISEEMKDLAKRAKENKLRPEEFQGGGFTISNLGMYGIKSFNAIINPPQSCILSIGAGSERAVVKGGQLAVANVMDVNLSCDHRVVDGAVGANFLKALKGFIENPITMFV